MKQKFCYIYLELIGDHMRADYIDTNNNILRLYKG